MAPTISSFEIASASAFYRSSEAHFERASSSGSDVSMRRHHSDDPAKMRRIERIRMQEAAVTPARVRTAAQVGQDSSPPAGRRSSAETRHEHDMHARQAARLQVKRDHQIQAQIEDLRHRNSKEGSTQSTDQMSEGSDRGVTMGQLADAAHNGGLRTRSRAELEMFRRMAAGDARDGSGPGAHGQTRTRTNSAPGAMYDPPSRNSSTSAPIEIIIHNEVPSRAGSRESRRSGRQGSGHLAPPNSSTEGNSTEGNSTDDTYMARRLRHRRSFWGHGPQIDYEGRAYATTKGVLKGLLYIVAGGGGLAGVGLVAHNTIGVNNNAQGINNIMQNLTEMAAPPMP